MMQVRSLLLAGACGVLIGACGQQGPLYLPDKAQDPVEAPQNQPQVEAGGASGAVTQPPTDPQGATPRIGRDPSRSGGQR